MVVFLDLEDENEPPEQVRSNHWLMQQHGNANLLRSLSLRSQIEDDEGRENPNKKKSITEALACYPYVNQETRRERRQCLSSGKQNTDNTSS